MIKKLLILCLVLCATSGLIAQTAAVIPVSGQLAATNDAVTGLPQSAPTVMIQLTGTWTGTVTFKGSADGGTTYVNILATNATDGVSAATTTANSIFIIGNAGYTSIQAVFTTATSGRVFVTMTRGFATSFAFKVA